MRYKDDNEPITKEWLESINIFSDGEGGDNYAVTISVDERTEISDPNEEATVLGYSFKDQQAYIENYGGDLNKTVDTKTNDLILLGVRKKRGEFRLLLRALNAWDVETWDERHPCSCHIPEYEGAGQHSPSCDVFKG